jgi:hypothetical protein
MAHYLQDYLNLVGAGDDYGFKLDEDAGGDRFQTSGDASQYHMV